ncbi:MAG TPA: PLP-dependent aminotransferase family protein [Anaerolineae bacterium]|nr:PLP-dependent aminotransferase family protein [Anaerolineae bacterium]
MNIIPSIILNPQTDIPLYQQLYQQIKNAILTGQLLPQTALPPTRQLAAQLNIGRNTVIAAYQQLTIEGFTYSQTGSGTYIANLPPLNPSPPFSPPLSPWGRRLPPPPTNPPPRPDLDIDFGFGRTFPHHFPYDIWRQLLSRYLSTDDTMLARYGSTAGFTPLRHALATYLRQRRGVVCQPEQIIIVSGAQQAVDIIARLFLTSGDTVLVENPGYRDVYALFQAHGARLHPLDVDDDGLPTPPPPPSRTRLLFITPTHQFPHGGTMPLPRRLALLNWAQKHQVIILEDDYDSELRYDTHPLAALQGLDPHGHVIYLGTFSKILFPALRLGYVVLPPPLVPLFQRAKGLTDRGAPTLTQAAVADFITAGHFQRHLDQLRRTYRQRWQAMMAALDQHLPPTIHYTRQPAGLHVMLRLPPETDEAALIQTAAHHGLGLYPGAPYHLNPLPPPTILLSYASLTPAQIHTGIARLAPLIPHP